MLVNNTTVFLSGYPPFNAAQQERILEKIKIGKYQFPADVKISADAKDFIRKLLKRTPAHRMSADKALAHRR
jgi:serine/threonine protein kinase